MSVSHSCIILKMKNLSVLYILLAGMSFNYLASAEHSRILNGQIAAEGQFPYAASIQFVGSVQGLTRGHRCGGALISLQHVVTAARCVYDIVNSVPQVIDYSQYRVFAGANLLTNHTSANSIRAIINVTVHPQYTGPPAYVNDIAILTLYLPFPPAAVKPISLPPANYVPPDFTLCTVIGWGANQSNSQMSVPLRYTAKYIYNQNLCTALYNGVPNVKNILPSMICAVSYDLLSSNCLGDEGNALVCGGRFTGILSTSNGCTASSYPEVYTRISNYTTWIRSISGSPTIFTQGTFFMIAIFSLIQIYFSTQ